jgi:hypothetical protein
LIVPLLTFGYLTGIEPQTKSEITCTALLTAIGIVNQVGEKKKDDLMVQISDPNRDQIIAFFETWIAHIDTALDEKTESSRMAMLEPVTDNEIHSGFSGSLYQLAFLPTFFAAVFYSHGFSEPTWFNYTIFGGTLLVGGVSFLYGTLLNHMEYMDLLKASVKKSKFESSSELVRFKSEVTAPVRELMLHIMGSIPTSAKVLSIAGRNNIRLSLEVGYQDGQYFLNIKRRLSMDESSD